MTRTFTGMNKGFILHVLLVTLSWRYMAASNTTSTAMPTTANSGTTTMAESTVMSTAMPTTANSGTTTMAESTVMSTAMPTTANSGTTTMAESTVMSTAMSTTANSGTTTMAKSTVMSTAMPTTANGGTTTMAESTVTGTAMSTTTAGTTAAPSNTATMIASIPSLPAPVSRQECGSTKLCADEPSECDPSTGDNCFFLSARRQSGQNFDFELSGQTRGYIAAGVSNAASQAGSHRAYICVNNNGNIGYLTGTIDDSVLNRTKKLDSSNEKGTVNNGKIQCTFTAALPDTPSRASTQYSLSITTGSYDASSEMFGRADFKVLTPLVNISDPAANVSNLLANDTSASSAVLVTPTKSFLPALLVTVCMLAFTVM